MDATPIRHGDRAGEISSAAAFAHLGAFVDNAAGTPLARKWAALHEAARTLAVLAGTASTDFRHLDDYPGTILACAGWRLMLAEQGLDDLTAIMDAGLVALLSVHDHGADPAPAARALWQEFSAARTALISLLPPAKAGWST